MDILIIIPEDRKLDILRNTIFNKLVTRTMLIEEYTVMWERMQLSHRINKECIRPTKTSKALIMLN